MIKWLKWIAITLLVLIVIIGSTLAWVLGTQSGLHFAINLAPRFVSGLTIGSVEGDLRSLTLNKIGYTMPGVDVKADNLHLSITLGCLKQKQLCINALTTQGVNVVVDTKLLPPAQEQTPSEPLTELSTPYPLFLDSLSLKDIKVAVDGNMIQLSEFHSAMQWQGKQLTIKPTVIDNLLIVLPKTTEEQRKAQEEQAQKLAQETPEKPLSETIKAIFAEPLLTTLPDVIIPLDLTVEGIHGQKLSLTGDTDFTINDVLIQLSNQGQQVDLQKITLDSPQGNIAINGQATLSEQWPVKLNLQGEIKDIDTFAGQKVDLQLDGVLLDELRLALALDGPVQATLEAKTNLSQADLPVQLTLLSKQVNWPLVGESEYQLNDIKLRLNGQVSDYALSLRSDIKGNEIPPALLTLDAKGNQEQINLTRLRLNALQGHADITGVADWSKAISWNAMLTLTGINTAKFYPEWPAKVDGKITTRGSLHGGSWQLALPEISLDGNVKNNQLKARGQASGNAAGQWDIPQFQVILGRNKVDIKGQLAELWKLDANINAPSLGGLLPGLAGIIKGDLKLRGNMDKPQVFADLNIQGLKWQQDLSIGSATIKGDVTSAEQISGQLAIAIKQLKQADIVISSLSLDAKGNENQHQLKLNMNGSPVSGHLALKGSFNRSDETWKGTLNDTAFETPVGEWRLNKAVAIDYFNQLQEVTVGTHCWVNPNARVCVPKPIKAGASGSAAIVLERFDLQMIKPLLERGTRLSGVFSGDANVKWFATGAQPEVKVNLKGNGVKVAQNVDGTIIPLAFNTLTLNVGMKNGNADLGWLFAIAGNGQIKGNIQVADLEKRRNLSGNIGIENITLDLIKPLLGKDEIANGAINANLRLGGNAQSPLLYGQFNLSNLYAKTHLIPFDITRGHLAVNFDGASSDLGGQIQTPEGYLNLSGNADWRNLDAWYARIAAQGDKLRISLPPMVKIDVNPDLVFEATPSLLKLDGNVNIPWARIKVQEIPESAVAPSSDIVMLDDNLQPIEEKKTSIPIMSNLNIHIGDDVQLDAFGLVASLTGNLKVIQDKQGLGLNGQVDIPDGRFHAYGQDLLVRKGQILFSGPPDQPFLNIEAIRNPNNTADNVVAGVRVTGLADRPKVEIFSQPAMSQENALSYLLRGEGLQSGDSDSAQMTMMLVSLGVAQSGQLVGKIGETFGISDLALDTQGVGESSQVVVSGKITNDLQVKYGVGIFDSLATLTLRYRLMPRLYLEAVSGLNQALDLLYQFEF